MSRETIHQPQDRITVLENLQRYLLPLADVDFEALRAQEFGAHEQVPTIGAEIEIPWSARFPEFSGLVFAGGSYSNLGPSDRQRFSVLCDELDARVVPMYEAVTRMGVPRDGNQKFWEFAHSPVRHHETLATEISLLARGGLLPEGYELPLHVTLGGLSGGSGGYFVQMMAEIVGGTTAERIRAPIGDMPIYDRKWARKAHDGLKERKSFELRGTNCGFEMRTFVFDSVRQASRVIRASQLLAVSLAEHRNRAQNKPHHQCLADEWQVAVGAVKEVESIGIQVSQPWQGPAENAEIWSRYAEFLEPGGNNRDLKQHISNAVQATIDRIDEIADETGILPTAANRV
jgi:hypothetical protein